MYMNGDGYCGQHVAGKREGKGILRKVTGETYDGEFVRGKYAGAGRQTYPDGSTFEGAFQFGVRHGRGRLIAKAGAILDAHWYCGCKAGRGVTYMSTGERQEANYHKNRLSGAPRIFSARATVGGSSTSRVVGASLVSMFVKEDRPVRLHLRMLPSWAQSRQLETVAVSHVFEESRSVPEAATAKLWLSVCAKPVSYDNPDFATAWPHTIAPEVRVSVTLRAVSPSMLKGDGSSQVGWVCAASTIVAPLLDWQPEQCDGHHQLIGDAQLTEDSP